jgi:hypothetical protein
MPILLPLAAVLTTALTVKTLNTTARKMEKRRKRKEKL